ncbi:MAG: hypothetical protein KAT15_28215 [Bacteroidales bacterium]|nr:hypothetical protein [Bacteroidales bacterium]
MKKLRYIIASLLVAFGFIFVSAQTGIGARGIFGVEGNSYGGVELSIQKLGRSEFDFGRSNDSWKFTGLKLINIVPRRNFALYGGIGGGVGYSRRYDELFGAFALDLGTYILIGPVQLGLDWRPEWNVFNYTGNDLSFNVALSGRLVFGKRKLR